MRKNGFTLMEIMVVIVIIGIILGMVGCGIVVGCGALKGCQAIQEKGIKNIGQELWEGTNSANIATNRN